MDIEDWNDRVGLNSGSNRGTSAHSQLYGEVQDGEHTIINVEHDINVIDVSPETRFENGPNSAFRVPSPSPPPPPNPYSLRLLNEIRNKNEDAVRGLLDEGANLGIRDENGKPVLMIAIANDDASMVRLLLEKGADLEATDEEGCSPLYLAVQSSNIGMVELILKFGPDVETLNSKTGKTAFHQAIEDGNQTIAELLLDNRADIDTKRPNGQTPLHTAVNSGKLDLVNFLLSHGASKRIRMEDGKTVEDIAEGDNAMIQLLQSSQLLEGPSMTNPTTTPETRFIYTPSLPADNIEKVYACRGFEATIVDFFGGDRERRIQVSSPIYDILYGKGPEAIMASARGAKLKGQKAMFRWYHLPANNMEWVQILASRISAEHHSGSLILDEDIKSKLALTNSPGRQYRATTAHSSFMRPLAQIVKPRIESLDSSMLDSAHNHVMLFIPYLHFETYNAYRRMAEVISAVKPGHISSGLAPVIGPVPPRPATWWPGKASKPNSQNVKSNIISLPLRGSDTTDTELSSGPEAASPFQIVRRGTQKLYSVFQVLKSRARGLALGHPGDLEGGALASGTQNDGNAIVPPQSSHLHESDNKLGTSKASPKENLDITRVIKLIPEGETHISIDQTPEKINKTALNHTIDIPGDQNHPKPHKSEKEAPNEVPYTIPSPINVDSQTQGIEPKVDLERLDSPKSLRTQQEAPVNDDSRSIPPPPSIQKIQSQKQKQKLALGNLDEHLIKAYLSPHKPGEMPPLQLRRTLDQYYYTHLASTEGRDADQVVLRYTKQASPEPKIFMVDQLWLWILNNDTVISCCPQRWDVSGGAPSFNKPPPRPAGHIPRSNPMPDSKRLNNLAPYWGVGSVPLPPPPPPNLYMQGGLGPPTSMPIKPKTKRKEKAGVLAWMAGGKRGRPSGQVDAKLPIRPDSSIDSNYDASDDDTRRRRRAKSEDLKRKRQAFLKNDPLNVHQRILKYLQGSARAPITSIQDMANLVVEFCVNVFDQYQVPDEYQFFEFFERSIGAVIDQEAQHFYNFAVTLANASQIRPGFTPDSDSLFSITAETQLLGEIKDISDELSILQMVLNDQLDTVQKFSKIMNINNRSAETKNTDSAAAARVENISNHLHKLAKMEKLAQKTYKSLNHLLDLKQKQANVSEALIARKQAEKTSAQAEMAAKHAEKGMGQAELAYKQATETARQGRTVMLFTVITIIFLPLSFVAAFFTINIDVFPVNENGKLPLNFVLKYMFSISGAVSIPFILIAFNQDRIADWVKGHGKASAIWFTIIIAATILISVVWSKSTVAPGMKAALTAVTVLAVVVGALAHCIYWLVSLTTPGFGESISSSSYSDGI